MVFCDGGSNDGLENQRYVARSFDRRFPDNSFFYVFTPNTYLSQNLDAIQWLTVSKIYPPNCAFIVAARLRGERSGSVTGNM